MEDFQAGPSPRGGRIRFGRTSAPTRRPAMLPGTAAGRLRVPRVRVRSRGRVSVGYGSNPLHLRRGQGPDSSRDRIPFGNGLNPPQLRRDEAPSPALLASASATDGIRFVPRLHSRPSTSRIGLRLRRRLQPATPPPILRPDEGRGKVEGALQAEILHKSKGPPTTVSVPRIAGFDRSAFQKTFP